MGYPTIAVEVSFTTNPGATPSWNDITSYVREFTIRRGRQHELSRAEAGTASVLLDNCDGTFDPNYSGGTYYGNILPMRRLRISATYGGSTYYQFEGFIEAWPQEYPAKDIAVVRIDASDGFKVLKTKKLSETYASELSGTRVTNVLDDAGWPAGDRSIDTGQSTLSSGTITNTKALQHLEDVIQSEGGFIFIDGDGDFIFHDRHRRLKSPYLTSQGTFGDDVSSELTYAQLELGYDDSQIWNEIKLTRTGGSEQTAEDSTSQTKYFKRTYVDDDLLISTDAEVLSAAQWRLEHHKEPHMRVKSITLNGLRDDNLWQHILGRELGDRITVKRRPPGGGTISQDCHIEAIRHNVGIGTWIAQWQLSPVDVNEYWILEDASYGKLGETTRLAW